MKWKENKVEIDILKQFYAIAAEWKLTEETAFIVKISQPELDINFTARSDIRACKYS